jgi:hypothetical protein
VGKLRSKQTLQATSNTGESDQFSHPAFSGKKVTYEQESRESRTCGRAKNCPN